MSLCLALANACTASQGDFPSSGGVFVQFRARQNRRCAGGSFSPVCSGGWTHCEVSFICTCCRNVEPHNPTTLHSVGGEGTGVWHTLDIDLLKHELDVSLEKVARAAPDATVKVLLTSPEDYVVAKVNALASPGDGKQGQVQGAGGVHQTQQSATARTLASLSSAGSYLQHRVAAGDVHSFGLASSSLTPQPREAQTSPGAKSFYMDATAVLGPLMQFPGFRALAHPINKRIGQQHQQLSAALRGTAGEQSRPVPWAQALDDPAEGAFSLLAVSPLQDRSWAELQLGWPGAAEGNSPKQVQGEFEAAWRRMMDHIAPLLTSTAADELEAGKWIEGFLQEAISKPVAAFPQHAAAAGMSRAWIHWQEHLMSTSANLSEAFEELDETTAQLLQQLFMASTRSVLCTAGQHCQRELLASFGADDTLAALNALLEATEEPLVPVAGALVDVQPHTSGLAQFSFQAPGHAPWPGTTADDFALGTEWTATQAWSNSR